MGLVTPGPVRVVGMGHALPAAFTQESVWTGFFAEHYRDVRVAERLFANAGVLTRHAVANPVHEDVSGWGTGARMERYLAEALPLGKDAVCAALDQADVAASDLGMLVVCSCTGYVTPCGSSPWPDPVGRSRCASPPSSSSCSRLS